MLMLPYQPIPNEDPSHRHICRPLALTEVTNLIFNALFMCFVLPCTFPSAIKQGGADRLNQKFVKSKVTQLGADHIPHPSLISPPTPPKHSNQSSWTIDLNVSEYRHIPWGSTHDLKPQPMVWQRNSPISTTSWPLNNHESTKQEKRIAPQR